MSDDKSTDGQSGALEAHVLEIAEAVDAQFDLYLFNSYSLEQLASLDPATVELPATWFRDWLDSLDTGTARGEHRGADV